MSCLPRFTWQFQSPRDREEDAQHRTNEPVELEPEHDQSDAMMLKYHPIRGHDLGISTNQRRALPEEEEADGGGGEGEDEDLHQGQHVTGEQEPDHLAAQDLVADQRKS